MLTLHLVPCHTINMDNPNTPQPVTSQVTQQPETPPPIPRSNILMIVVISFVMLGAGLIGGYLLFSNKSQTVPTQTEQPVTQISPTEAVEESNTTDSDISNWKTYEDAMFSIKYPPTYTIIIQEPIQAPEYPLGGNTVIFSSDTGRIILSRAVKPANITISNALGKGPYLRYTEETLRDKVKNTYEVGGSVGVSVENISAGQNGTALDVVWIRDNTIYQAETENPEQVDVLKKMLSTFTFNY